MSDSKSKLNQEEYEKLIRILSQRKQSKEKEIPFKTVISALDELNLLEELEKDDIRAIQGKASEDIKKHSKGIDIIGKAKLFLSLALLSAFIYAVTQLFPGVSHSLWQSLISVITSTEEVANTSSSTTTDSGQATVTEGNTLNPGQAISNEEFSIVAENPLFVNLPNDEYFMTFEVVVSNNSGEQLVTQITGENISVVAGNGKTYPEIKFWRYDSKNNKYDYEGSISSNLDIYSLAPGQVKKLKFGVAGKLDKNVNNIIVKMKNAGRIKNSKWNIKVPR